MNRQRSIGGCTVRIQTDPKKGWFTILRLYSPLEAFFTKEWRPSEIALVEKDGSAAEGVGSGESRQ